MVFKAGQQVLVQWERGKSPQARLLIAPATAEEFHSVMGKAVPPAVGVECLWWAATPDGDVYPHMLHARGVYSAMALDRRGRGRPASMIGRQLDTEAAPYGANWSPSPAFFLECLEFVTGLTFDGMLKTALEHSDDRGGPEDEDPDKLVQAPATKKGGAPGKSSHHRLLKNSGEAIELPPDLHVEEGLPDPAPDHWYAVGATDDRRLGKVSDLNAMLSFTISGIGLALYHGYAVIYSTQPPKDSSLDARVLGIRETTEEGRHLAWRDAVSEFSETDWPKFPISGPRTTFWVSRYIRDHDVAPRSRHAKWRAEVGLTAGDQSVIDHEFCCRLLQLAVVYDQLHITELACMELVARKLQMCEYRHRDRAIGATQGDDLLEDAHLYMGVGETRGLVMVAPSLLSYVAEKLKTEAAILKERRKMREERAEQQTAAGSKDGKGSAALQSLVDKQRAEINKLKTQLAAPGKGGKSEESGRPPGGK